MRNISNAYLRLPRKFSLGADAHEEHLKRALDASIKNFIGADALEKHPKRAIEAPYKIFPWNRRP